ncbi:hypothetical protein [Actinomadura sp. 7K507]|uniref:hypothetical protein n=1 Tax=Actinomadura sp. 7K507 TaxID=2530365 RepID=UPI0010E792C5|nr:hypothetical protein [Actinomadura sp. 7K507]TDC84898.1 hypothetical protein E1285_26020 [Actinomadura sp. 7K507]
MFEERSSMAAHPLPTAELSDLSVSPGILGMVVVGGAYSTVRARLLLASGTADEWIGAGEGAR